MKQSATIKENEEAKEVDAVNLTLTSPVKVKTLPKSITYALPSEKEEATNASTLKSPAKSVSNKSSPLKSIPVSPTSSNLERQNSSFIKASISSLNNSSNSSRFSKGPLFRIQIEDEYKV